jgi:hypothetical protein
VHRETSGSTFLPPSFSALCREFSSTICDRIETEISRGDLRPPRAAHRVSQMISVRVSVARDFCSKIGQALSKKKENEGTRGDLVVATHLELRALRNAAAPSCRRRLDPDREALCRSEDSCFEPPRRRPLERGRSSRWSRDDPAPLCNFMK